MPSCGDKFVRILYVVGQQVRMVVLTGIVGWLELGLDNNIHRRTLGVHGC